MLRSKQHARNEVLPWPGMSCVRPPWHRTDSMPLAGPSGTPLNGRVDGRGDLRVPVLLELMDSLDMDSFLFDPDCRRRLNEVLDAFSDDEFDRFERFYSRRFISN